MAGDLDLITQKVMLLYVVNRLPGLTRNRLLKICAEAVYLNYFTFGQLSDELLADGQLESATGKGEQEVDADGLPVSRLYLTPAGDRVLRSLEPKLPLAIVRNLNRAAAAFLKDGGAGELAATVTPEKGGSFSVRLSLNEGSRPLCTIKLNLPGKEPAEKVRSQWLSVGTDLYPELLRLLTGPGAVDRATAAEHDANRKEKQ